MTRIGLIARAFSETPQSYGLRMATTSYIQALSQHAPFEKIDLFGFEDEQADLANLIRSFGSSASLTIYPTQQLKHQLITQTYTLLLGLDPEFGAILLDFRNQTQAKTPVFILTHTLSSPALNGLFSKISQLACPEDAVICTSQAGQKTIEKRLSQPPTPYQGQTLLLPLSIHPPDLSGSDNLRKQLDLTPEDWVIGYVGRINVLTKTELTSLILIIRRLLADGLNPVLLIAGKLENPSYLSHLKQWVTQLGLAQSVRFFLDFESKDRPLLWKTLDIFVSLSEHIQETFGLTLLEAMAAKKPVVASDWSGYKDIVDNNKTGFLIPTYWGDVLSRFDDTPYFPTTRFGDEFDQYFYQVQSVAVDIKIATQQLKALHDSRLRTQMGQAGFDRYSNLFSWPTIFKTLKAAAEKSAKTMATRSCFPTPSTPLGMGPLFKHYPTRSLQLTDKVGLSAFGQSILDPTQPHLLVYQGLWDSIFESVPIWQDLIQSAGSGSTVGNLKHMFSEHADETVTLNLLFALKYDLLELLE